MTESFAEKMKAGTRELNITLSQRQLEQFFKYYEMLVETNKVMNLTAITEEGDVVAKHFCDSLCLVKAYHELQTDGRLQTAGTELSLQRIIEPRIHRRPVPYPPNMSRTTCR